MSVEGRVRVSARLAEGRLAAVDIAAERPLLARRLLVGRTPAEALALLPTLFSLHHQQPARGQVLPGPCQDPPHHVEAVIAGREPEPGLAQVLARQLSHLRLRHIGRVAHDDIVATVAEAAVNVRQHRPHAAAEAVHPGVARRHLQRRVRHVGGVHPGLWKGESTGDGDATGAGAEVQDAADP